MSLLFPKCPKIFTSHETFVSNFFQSHQNTANKKKLKVYLLLQVDPMNGTVGFGSGLQGWAFTLKDFASLYKSRFNIEEKKLMKRLWGDNFYHEKEKKWLKTCKEDMSPQENRGFIKYILDPIYKVSYRNVSIFANDCFGFYTP